MRSALVNWKSITRHIGGLPHKTPQTTPVPPKCCRCPHRQSSFFSPERETWLKSQPASINRNMIHIPNHNRPRRPDNHRMTATRDQVHRPPPASQPCLIAALTPQTKNVSAGFAISARGLLSHNYEQTPRPENSKGSGVFDL